jgi:hypothetical protein
MMTSNKVIKKRHKMKPNSIEELKTALKWLLGIASTDTPSGADASKVVKLIKNMSGILQQKLIEDLKASSEQLDLVLAEFVKFPPDGAVARLKAQLVEISSVVVEFLKDTSLCLPFATRRFKADVEEIYGSIKKRDVGSKYLPVSPERLNLLQFPVPQVIESRKPARAAAV